MFRVFFLWMDMADKYVRKQILRMRSALYMSFFGLSVFLVLFFKGKQVR